MHAPNIEMSVTEMVAALREYVKVKTGLEPQTIQITKPALFGSPNEQLGYVMFDQQRNTVRWSLTTSQSFGEV